MVLKSKEKDGGRSHDDGWSARESFDGSVVLVSSVRVLVCESVRVLERRVLSANRVGQLC